MLLKLPCGGNSMCKARNVDINCQTYAMLILSHVNVDNLKNFIYTLKLIPSLQILNALAIL